MARNDAAANAVTHAVTDYAPDPMGAGFFHSLTSRIGRTLRDDPPVIERHPTWYGWTQAPQRFIGQAAALGVASVYAERAGQMNAQRADLDSNTAAVFYQRMAQGRG